MICALTVRKLRPGTFDEFRTAFLGDMLPSNPPEGWVRFHMVRGTEDPDEVVCFGFFDGTREQLRAGGQDGQDDQRERIAPYVLSTGTDQLFEVVEDWLTSAPATA